MAQFPVARNSLPPKKYGLVQSVLAPGQYHIHGTTPFFQVFGCASLTYIKIHSHGEQQEHAKNARLWHDHKTPRLMLP
jgi:hypothetical protein